MPLRSDGQRNRDALIASAQEVLARDPDATLQDVAAAAGVGRRTLYRHFESREELIAELFAAGRRSMQDEIERRCVGRPAAQALARLAPILVDAATRYRFIGDVEGARLAAEAPSPVALVGLLRQAQKGGELRSDVSVEWMVDAMRGLARTAAANVEHRRMSRPEAERALSATLVSAFSVQ